MSRLSTLMVHFKGYRGTDSGPMTHLSRKVFNGNYISDVYPHMTIYDKRHIVETFLKLPRVLEHICPD